MNTFNDIAIFGAGGLGREIACLIKLINIPHKIWNFVGFFDDNELLWGGGNDYGKILGGIDKINNWDKPLCLVVAIGNPLAIQKIVSSIHNDQISYPNIIAPSVIFLDECSSRLGRGNIICSNCLISCNTNLGDFNLLNGNIPLGHDTRIGNYNVIMPSVNISGGVEIGDLNFFGVQSVVLQGIKIGNNTRIGANSVIIRNTKDGLLYIGNPATKVKF